MTDSCNLALCFGALQISNVGLWLLGRFCRSGRALTCGTNSGHAEKPASVLGRLAGLGLCADSLLLSLFIAQ